MPLGQRPHWHWLITRRESEKNEQDAINACARSVVWVAERELSCARPLLTKWFYYSVHVMTDPHRGLLITKVSQLVDFGS